MDDASRIDSGDFGDLDVHDGHVVLTFTRRRAHPQQKVWRGLTEPAHVAAWFPTTIDGEQTAGAALRFRFRDLDIPPVDGEMRAFEPPSLMELLWGDELLRFELAPDGEGTLLTFTCRFDEVGRAARDGAGWHECLDQLDHAVAETAAPWSSPDRWREIHDQYVARFGPAASTVGPPPEWEEAHPGASGDTG